MYVRMYVCMYVYMYVCMYVCMNMSWYMMSTFYNLQHHKLFTCVCSWLYSTYCTNKWKSVTTIICKICEIKKRNKKKIHNHTQSNKENKQCLQRNAFAFNMNENRIEIIKKKKMQRNDEQP